MFAGMSFTIFDAVATIANNINSNNNNLNDQNINFQMSTNTVVTGNINVANQINVMNATGQNQFFLQQKVLKRIQINFFRTINPQKNPYYFATSAI